MKKVKDIYFVDCENVGCKRLPVNFETSYVYYFTSNANRVYPIENLSEHEEEIHIHHKGMKDSMDFILDSKLGFAINLYGKKVNYHIISGDKGFDVVADYWRSFGYTITRQRLVSFLITKEDYCKLSEKADILMSQLSEKQNIKLYHVYQNWMNSNSKNIDNLYDDIIRCSKNCMNISDCKVLHKYLYVSTFPNSAIDKSNIA